MFTHKNPHAATAARRSTRITASIGAAALGAGLALAAPLSASADEVPQSYAEGQFLSGTLLGTDLSNLVAVAGAEAFNDGTQSTQTVKDPFQVTALGAVTIGSGQSLQLSLGDVLQLGAISQYAEAAPDGVSTGASGAVAEDGAIGVGGDSSAPLGTTTLDLQPLLDGEFADSITDLNLVLDAVAARADGEQAEATGDYSISGARLQFSSPAISRLTERVDQSLQVVDDELDRLAGDDGELLDLVSQLVADLNPALDLLGANANVSATIDSSELTQAVHGILSSSYGDGGISFNLETGVVSVDLEKYVGELNNLPPNTELLSDRIIGEILGQVTGTVTTLADQIVATVEDVIRDLDVRIHADLAVDVAQAPVVEEVCRTVERVIQVPVPEGDDDGLGGLVGGLVGGVVGGVTGTVEQLVTELVCEDVTTVLEPLRTGLVLDVGATIDELIRGAGVAADLDAQVAGIPVSLDLQLILDELGALLNEALFTGDTPVDDLVDALDANLVDPALEGLLGGGGSVEAALTDVLSVKVNVQETTMVGGGGMARGSGTYFTQTAVRVSALGGDLATLNLASATVGPNAATDVDDPDDPTDPTDPTDPGCVDDCSAGGGDGGSRPGSLATTGIGVAILVAAILALLAAGAYMARESYRRSRGDVHVA